MEYYLPPIVGATNSRMTLPSADAGNQFPTQSVQHIQGSGNERQTPGKASTAQKTFWQAITMGCFETIKVLLEHREININQYDVDGEQRQGGTALHLAILEMPTWKGSEGRNGIQTAEFVSKMIRTLLDHGADTEMVCRYKGEWYLQTAAGKTKSFFPEGYDALGLVLQFIEITRGAEVIANDVTKRLELIRDILLQHIHKQDLLAKQQLIPSNYKPQLPSALVRMFEQSKFSDVEIRCEGRVFRAHKMVLAARSVVFEKMFSSNLLESQVNSTVDVKEVDPDALEGFLRFLYTDKIDDSHVNHASDLLVLANRYDVEDLKDLCTQALAKSLTVHNAASILAIADSSQAPLLKRCALHFFAENIKAIREECEDYAHLDANLMREILDSFVDQPPRKKQRVSGATFVGASRPTGSGPMSMRSRQDLLQVLASPVQEQQGQSQLQAESASLFSSMRPRRSAHAMLPAPTTGRPHSDSSSSGEEVHSSAPSSISSSATLGGTESNSFGIQTEGRVASTCASTGASAGNDISNSSSSSSSSSSTTITAERSTSTTPIFGFERLPDKRSSHPQGGSSALDGPASSCASLSACSSSSSATGSSPAPPSAAADPVSPACSSQSSSVSVNFDCELGEGAGLYKDTSRRTRSSSASGVQSFVSSSSATVDFNETRSTFFDPLSSSLTTTQRSLEVQPSLTPTSPKQARLEQQPPADTRHARATQSSGEYSNISPGECVSGGLADVCLTWDGMA